MVSRETVVADSGIYSVFQNKLFDDFESGTSFGQLTLDAAALFLCVASNKLKSNIFLSFKNEKAAYSFYLLATGLEPDRFLFYPAADLGEKVPGFNIESERYREDALIKLAEKNRFYVCVTTRSSLKEKNISINSSSNLSSMSICPGNKIDRDDVINRLRSWGFKKTDTVAEPKDFAWRGDILDVFPIYFRRPVRVVFNFDQVENIFIFDPLTQLTTKTIARLNIKGFSSVAPVDDYINLVDYAESSIVADCIHRGDGVELKRGSGGRAENLMCLPIDFKNHLLTKRISQIKSEILRASDSLFIVGNENEKGFLGGKFKDATWIGGNLQQGFFSPFLKIGVLSSSDILNEKRSVQKWKPTPAKQHKTLT